MRVPSFARPLLTRSSVLGVAFTIAGLALASSAASRLAAQNAGPEATERLVTALGLHDGSTVAEIGAGSGTRTIAIARRVGATGHVYSSELGDKNLRTLRKAVDDAHLPNVTIVEAQALSTNLPEGCCDAIYMEFVYHHFDDPTAMNASIFRSLKPGGRVAVVDFPPGNGTEAARPEDRDQDPRHGVTSASVKAEFEKAGFEAVDVDTSRNRAFLVVMRKPTS